MCLVLKHTHLMIKVPSGAEGDIQRSTHLRTGKYEKTCILKTLSESARL